MYLIRGYIDTFHTLKKTVHILEMKSQKLISKNNKSRKLKNYTKIKTYFYSVKFGRQPTFSKRQSCWMVLV